jgi:hypothetical protein
VQRRTTGALTMSIVRDLPITLVGLEERSFQTCSTGAQVFASTANQLMVAALGTITANGRIIDRLYDLPASYSVASPVATLASTRGSTEADRRLTLGVKLQHGDSSGGGDMADYSTGSTPASRNYFSTARSTDHASWDATESTGEVVALANPGYYDIRAAKQFVRVAVTVGKNRVTTESSGDEQARVGADITFCVGDRLPQNADAEGPYSESTST